MVKVREAFVSYAVDGKPEIKLAAFFPKHHEPNLRNVENFLLSFLLLVQKMAPSGTVSHEVCLCPVH